LVETVACRLDQTGFFVAGAGKEAPRAGDDAQNPRIRRKAGPEDIQPERAVAAPLAEAMSCTPAMAACTSSARFSGPTLSRTVPRGDVPI